MAITEHSVNASPSTHYLVSEYVTVDYWVAGYAVSVHVFVATNISEHVV